MTTFFIPLLFSQSITWNTADSNWLKESRKKLDEIIGSINMRAVKCCLILVTLRYAATQFNRIQKLIKVRQCEFI